MNSVVTQRFIKCLEKLLDTNMVRSSRQFAISLDYLPQSLSEIVKGRRDVTIELLRKAIDTYKLNSRYLFEGEGDMFLKSESEQKDFILTVVTDNLQEEKIVHVPFPAQAGYGGQISDPFFFSELPSYSLPDFQTQRGTHRSFDITGDSMEPSLFEGDKVVCSFVEKDQWTSCIKNGYVYVVVTENDVLIKRLYNKINLEKSVILVSDNSFYPERLLPVNQILEVWYVKLKISPFMASPSNMRNSFSEEVDKLKEIIEQQSSVIKTLNLTIEKMLKQNRARI